MPRVISFFLLVAILALAGAVFFQVMAPFVLPMFVAAVLVVVFKPLHVRVCNQLPGRPRGSALVTTALILLTVLVPTSWLAWKAYQQSEGVVTYLRNEDNRKEIAEQFNSKATELQKWYKATFPGKENEKDLDLQTLLESLLGAGNAFVNVAHAAIKLIVGLAIMVLSLYYFLADGPQIIHSIMLLSPLDPEYEQELLNRFVNVSRAVVSASLATAVAQGLLAGIGFYFALNPGAPIFLLIAATIVLAIVPVVGGASVWVPVCIWIYVFQTHTVDGQLVKGDTFSALGLAFYCGVIVSTIDNFIKPWVLHGQSNLHPLLALLSILGGLAALGPVGILIGPLVVAFVQALLVMVNKELARMGDDERVAAGFRGGPQGAVASSGGVPRESSYSGKRGAVAAKTNATEAKPAEKVSAEEMTSAAKEPEQHKKK